MDKFIILFEILGPSVIIITVNHSDTTAFAPQKPPRTISLANVINAMSIVPSSSAIFDMVSFLSAVTINGVKNLVSATKIKQRWRISSSPNLIGDGEQLCQLLVRSHIIILERVNKKDGSFLHAIQQCCSLANVESVTIEDDTKTFREAVKQIEKNPNLKQLRDAVSACFINFYECPDCNNISDSLTSTIDSVSLYQQTSTDSEFYAASLMWNTDSSDISCSKCLKQFGDRILTPFRQDHHRCPNVLMLQAETSTRQKLKNLRLNLNNDLTGVTNTYNFISALLVDRYESISLVKLTLPDKWTIYCKPPYFEPASLSNTEIDDLFLTVQTSILFLRKVSYRWTWTSVSD